MNALSKLTPRTVQVFLVDLALTVAGLALLTLGARAVWHENLGLAGTALTAGLVLLFSSTIHRFESLKGLGIEAKTRELDRTIDKAEVTVAQMKRLAEVVGFHLVKLNSEVGRIGTTPTIFDAYAQSREVKALLLEIGSDEQAIRGALTPWARMAAFDLYRYFHGQIKGRFTEASRQLTQRGFTANMRDEGIALKQRATALTNYRGPESNATRLWNDHSFITTLRAYIDGAPEKLDAEAVAEINRALEEAEREFSALASTLDFADPNYWENLPIR